MQLPDKNIIKEIQSAELRLMIEEGSEYQLIDVRTPEEHDAFNIGGTLISLDELISNFEKIETDKPVVIYCKVGLRSHIAIQRLQEKYNFQNLFNLKGGIMAYLTA